MSVETQFARASREATFAVMAAARAPLTPVQQWAFDGLISVLQREQVFRIWGGQGSGKSTVLRALQQALGGARLGVKDFIDAQGDRHPLALEESFVRVALAALMSNTCVFIDDVDLLEAATFADGNPRRGWLTGALTLLCNYATEADKRLFFAGSLPCEIQARAFGWWLQQYRVEDYAALCCAFLPGGQAETLDFAKIHRFGPNLNAYQLRNTCVWLGKWDSFTTDHVIAYLREHHVTSNVDLEEVQAVDLHDLKGLDDLIQSLETHVILPLENEQLAAEFQLRPKRGVLLAGPPGTGKTTVGRALAHRLKSKFFLIDGTVVAGSSDFYRKVQAIFEAAKQNSDSILFIDDSDVIFENGKDTGLYRYLLTMLDGLESKSAGHVCVMLTAMEVAKLPPALLRSGRIELWLETRLPDAGARWAIVSDQLAPTAAAVGPVDKVRLVVETDGFTGADLKRVVDDGKLLLAQAQVSGERRADATDYFLEAADQLRAHKERYAAARGELAG